LQLSFADVHAAAAAILTTLAHCGAATAVGLTTCGCGAVPQAFAREAAISAVLAALLAAGHVSRTGAWYILSGKPPAATWSSDSAELSGGQGALGCTVAPPLRSLSLVKPRAVKRRVPRSMPPPPPVAPRKRKGAVSDEEGDATWDARAEAPAQKGKKRVSFRLEVED